MTRDNFNSLANRLEVAWCDRPEGLLKQTVGWVMLGYVTLLASVAAGLLLLAGGVVLAVHYQGVAGTLLAGAVAAAGLALAFFILGCLWVRFEPPAGQCQLGQADSPLQLGMKGQCQLPCLVENGSARWIIGAPGPGIEQAAKLLRGGCNVFAVGRCHRSPISDCGVQAGFAIFH